MKRCISWFTVVGFIATLLISTFVFAADYINVNTANHEQLKALNGVGDARADAIIQHREKYGPFQSFDDFKNVKGIGDKIIEANRDIIIFQEGASEAENPCAKSDTVMSGAKN